MKKLVNQLGHNWKYQWSKQFW